MMKRKTTTTKTAESIRNAIETKPYSVSARWEFLTKR